MESILTIPASCIPPSLSCIATCEKDVVHTIRKFQLDAEPLDIATKGYGAHHYAFMPHVDTRDCTTKISRIVEICSFFEGSETYQFYVAAICLDAIHIFKGVDFKRNRKFPYVSLKYLDVLPMRALKIHPAFVTKCVAKSNVVFLHSLAGKVVQVNLASEVGRIIHNEIPVPRNNLERCFQYHSSNDSLIYISGKEHINIMKAREDKPNFSQPIGYGRIIVSMGILTPDMRSYIVATTDGIIFVIDAITGYKKHKVDSFQHKAICCMAVLNDNIHVLLGFCDGTLLKISTEENTEDSVVSMSTAHHSAIATIVVQKESYIDRFATLNNGIDKLLILWSGKNNIPLQRFHFTEKIQFDSLEFLTDHNILFVGSSEGHLLIFKMTDEEEVCQILEKVHRENSKNDTESFHDTTLERICRMDTTINNFAQSIENYIKNGGFDADYEMYGSNFEVKDIDKSQETYEPMQISSEEESQPLDTPMSSNENSSSQPKFSPTQVTNSISNDNNVLQSPPTVSQSVFGNISDSDDD
uniref:WD_REPEATS_REGION domain-containing protein n=1 Tax=Parastrongyloides trichosuri TaxID=131310 RepID=A0A0N4ZMI2_PARTI